MALKFSVVKLLQSSNALFPMEVTLLGMVIEVKTSQPLTKFAGMRCTLSPIFTVVKAVPKGFELKS